MFEPFTLPFVQRALVEIALLAVAAGLVGTWIVLRGLAFHAHAVATATFPGLVLADGLGFAAPLGALGAAALFTAGVSRTARRGEEGHGAAVALVLVACLAGGVILASDVFASGANVETLLFGSLLLIGWNDVAVAAGAALLALAATALLGRRWLAEGFDPPTARLMGLRSGLPEAALLAVVATTAVAALVAVGALLATALLVVPAVTTRLVAGRMVPWQVATIALAALEGTVGLWLSVETNAPPGATIAVVGGAVFAAVALARRLGARRLVPAAAVAAAALLGLAGCGAAAGGGSGPGVTVVATTPVIADLARHVAGGRAEVVQILQPNTDPHEYEPRPSDVRHAAEADVVLRSGLKLDAWMDDVIAQSGAHPEVVDLSRGLPVRLGGDPHWWHDPRNAEAAAGEIAAALTRADPAGRAAYRRGAAAYERRLRALDAAIRGCVDRIPPARRTLVTDHDAFGYLAHRYGLRIVGAVIPSQTTQAQASAGEVARLVAAIRREHVPAVFPEASVNRKLADAIARETGASIGGELYGDTLGAAGSSGATYVQAERHDADAIVRGLTGGRTGCA